MIIITGKSSPRIEYIFRFVLESVLGYNIRFNEEPASGEAVLVYMDTPPQTQSIHIVPHGLLTQNDITSQEITMTNWEDLPVFFDTDGQIPFDLCRSFFWSLVMKNTCLTPKTNTEDMRTKNRLPAGRDS